MKLAIEDNEVIQKQELLNFAFVTYQFQSFWKSENGNKGDEKDAEQSWEKTVK